MLRDCGVAAVYSGFHSKCKLLYCGESAILIECCNVVVISDAYLLGMLIRFYINALTSTYTQQNKNNFFFFL